MQKPIETDTRAASLQIIGAWLLDRSSAAKKNPEKGSEGAISEEAWSWAVFSAPDLGTKPQLYLGWNPDAWEGFYECRHEGKCSWRWPGGTAG